MSIHLASNESLNDRIRLTYWSEFKYIYHTVKEVAAQIRQDNRRKKREFVTGLAISPIKEIVHSVSRMYQHRYSDEALFQILAEAIRKINLLVRKIREFEETKYVDILENISSLLISFMGDNQSVQLELFDPQTYHDPEGAKRKLPCFYRWYNGILREISLHFRDKSRKVGFSNPYINCGKIPYTQLSIPFDRANIASAKKRYLAAYFDFEPTPAVSPTSKVDTASEENGTADVDFTKLGLRILRKIASYLGVAQKIDGKDRSKASFIEELEGLLGTKRQEILVPSSSS